MKRDYLEEINSVYGELYLVLGWESVTSAHSPILLRCKRCGHERKGKVTYFVNNKRLKCPECERRKKIGHFLSQSRSNHNNTYTYPYIQTEYTNNVSPITAICPIHGEFKVIPHSHIKGNGKCPECYPDSYERTSKIHPKYTKEEFIQLVKEKWGEDTYDVTESDFRNMTSKISVKCKCCNRYFTTTPHDLLQGHGCPDCGKRKSGQKRRRGIADCIEQCRKAHNNFYHYNPDTFNYRGEKYPINVICPIHGEFQTLYSNHSQGYGLCPKCDKSGRHNAENRFFNRLKEDYPDLTREYRNTEQFGRLSFDAYIPSLNVLIEYQGGHHFQPVELFGGEEIFSKHLERDLKKIRLCERYGYTLLHVAECKIPDDFNHYNVIPTIVELRQCLENLQYRKLRNE